jgi:hypothetical protein
VIVADERVIDADPDAFKALRGRFPKAIVVALSAPMRLRRAGRQGVDCTVEKPAHDEQLLRAIQWALELTDGDPADALAWRRAPRSTPSILLPRRGFSRSLARIPDRNSRSGPPGAARMISRCTVALALALAAGPALADEGGADLRLLGAELSLARDGGALRNAPAADLSLRAGTLLAMADPAGATTAGAAAGSLDFDLLGTAPEPGRSDPKVEAEANALKRRRTLLEWHQGVGLALIAAEVGTTVFGQLNYDDKFAGTAPANTNRYRAPHAVFAVSTLGLFAANGVIALLAPAPGRTLRLDRVMAHRVSMALATVGMIAQAYYGFRTSGREGYLDQASIAKTHLAIGYGTLAAFAVGVGAITF